MAAEMSSGNVVPSVTIAAILLLSWSTLTIAIRLWVKLRKADVWGTDDTTISAAFTIAVFHVVAVCLATSYGYGDPEQDLNSARRIAAEKAFFASQILYVAASGLTRISVSCFIVRLTRDENKSRVIKAAIWGSIALAIAQIFIVSFRGNIAKPWLIFDGTKTMYIRWLIIEVSGIVQEIALWTISAWLIWGLHMPTSKRISVLTILAVRFLVIPLIVLRLCHLSPSDDVSSTRPAITAAVYMELVIQVSIMLSSITCAKPFLRPFHSGFFVSTTGYARSRGLSYAKGTTSKINNSYQTSSRKSRSSKAWPGGDENDEAPLNLKGAEKFRPEQLSHQAVASAGSTASHENRLETMVISRTDDWTVTYEDLNQAASNPVSTRT